MFIPKACERSSCVSDRKVFKNPRFKGKIRRRELEETGCLTKRARVEQARILRRSRIDEQAHEHDHEGLRRRAMAASCFYLLRLDLELLNS